MYKSNKGIIFNIQRFSVNDGPGIRTTIFLKGCPLKCLWCFNPEGIKTQPEIIWYNEKCGRCFRCIEVCPNHAIIHKKISIITNMKKCNTCGKCEEVCFYEARKIIGKYMNVKEVLNEILKDKLFYENSGGGITLSGGEVTLQPEFALSILKESKRKDINTAIETCGYAKWSIFKTLIPYIDLILYDLKQIDEAKHRIYTGVSLDLIIDNLSRIDQIGIPLWIRIPFIPGYTDQEENIFKVANFLSRLQSIQRIDLLLYRTLGIPKYKSLGIKYPLEKIKPPGKEKMKKFEEIIKSFVGHYITIKVG
jgi:pyruvate formate lyase activating enzyme